MLLATTVVLLVILVRYGDTSEIVSKDVKHGGGYQGRNHGGGGKAVLPGGTVGGCDSSKCPRVMCQSPITPPGQCCPICGDQPGVGGNAIYIPGGPIGGCDPSKCPHLLCQSTITLPGQCCPVCGGLSGIGGGVSPGLGPKQLPGGGHFGGSGGGDHGAGGTVGGCNQVNCALVGCQNPITLPGQCCPVCSSGVLPGSGHLSNGGSPGSGHLSYGGSKVLSGGEHRRGDSSEGGGVGTVGGCNPASCPTVVCQNPITLPGQCCRVCTGNPGDGGLGVLPGSGHLGNGGSKGIPEGGHHGGGPLDLSRGGVGIGGGCNPASCPTVVCQNPITLPGQCCRVCTGHPGDGGKDVFPGSGHPSGSGAGALHSAASCSLEKCPPVRCRTPVTKPGDCCPYCPPGVY